MDEDELEEQEPDRGILNPPDEVELRAMLSDMEEYWKTRDAIVCQGREHLAMENTVTFPDVAHFEPQKLLMGEIRAFVNERQAQFRSERQVSVIPFGLGEPAKARAGRLERGINSLLYWLSQGRDAWGKNLTDTFLFDSSWERWEPAMQAAWPRLVMGEDGHDEFTRVQKDNPNYDPRPDREKYKMQRAMERKLPLVNSYVPLEYCFPAKAGDELDYVLEIELRPTRSLRNNPVFDKGAVASVLASWENNRHDVRSQITIVRYCDANVYAYYALTPQEDRLYESRTAPHKRLVDRRLGGNAVLLHKYEHKVGRPLYNEIFGANGGWGDGDVSMVAGRVKLLLQLAQARDELASQAMTIARNTAWGGQVITISDERTTTDGGDPNLDGLQGKLGEDIILRPGETMRPMFAPQPNPFYEVVAADVVQQIRKISGGPSLYGMPSAGVSTGYAQQLEIARSEGQFARVQQGIARGGANGIYLMLEIVKNNIAEPVHVMALDQKRSSYDMAVIDPKDLDPMPMIDVSIQAPRPNDWTASLADFRAATSDIGNHGPALSMETAREKMLGIEDAEEEALKIRIEKKTEELWNSELPMQLIAEAIMVRIIEDSVPSVGAGDVAGAIEDPNFLAQMQAFAGGQRPVDEMTGLPQDPTTAQPSSEAMGIGQGVGGGMAPGSAQPMQTQAVGQVAIQGGLAG